MHDITVTHKVGGTWLAETALHACTHTHTHPFNCPLSRTTRVSRYQKGKTNLDFNGARDSEWQWNPLGHMQVCTLHQTDNHASTPQLSFLQAGCPSCHPTNSVKALKVIAPKAIEGTETALLHEHWRLHKTHKKHLFYFISVDPN